jgi:hypothetical protein
MEKRLFIILGALVVVAASVRIVEAQFVTPTCLPSNPTCNPQVIQNVLPASTAQAASINVTGTIRTNGCFGATYSGITGSSYNGQRAGYKDVDTLCNAAFAGTHVCSVEEILESIQCNVALPSGQNGWVNGGPPGFTADSNDCKGWTTTVGAYGRVWQFNATTGGSGTMSPCASALPYVCCK